MEQFCPGSAVSLLDDCSWIVSTSLRIILSINNIILLLLTPKEGRRTLLIFVYSSNILIVDPVFTVSIHFYSESPAPYNLSPEGPDSDLILHI